MSKFQSQFMDWALDGNEQHGVDLLREHQLPGSTGALSTCSCGARVIDYYEHLIQLSKEEDDVSKIETQLEVNGVTYSGKDLDLICLGMSLKEESIIKLLKTILVGNSKGLAYCYECGGWDDLYPDVVALIKGENK